MSRDARSALSDSGGMWRLAEATDEQREDEETKRGPDASASAGHSIEKHPDMIICTGRHFPPTRTSAR